MPSRSCGASSTSASIQRAGAPVAAVSRSARASIARADVEADDLVGAEVPEGQGVATAGALQVDRARGSRDRPAGHPAARAPPGTGWSHPRGSRPRPRRTSPRSARRPRPRRPGSRRASPAGRPPRRRSPGGRWAWGRGWSAGRSSSRAHGTCGTIGRCRPTRPRPTRPRPPSRRSRPPASRTGSSGPSGPAAPRKPPQLQGIPLDALHPDDRRAPGRGRLSVRARAGRPPLRLAQAAGPPRRPPDDAAGRRRGARRDRLRPLHDHPVRLHDGLAGPARRLGGRPAGHQRRRWRARA